MRRTGRRRKQPTPVTIPDHPHRPHRGPMPTREPFPPRHESPIEPITASRNNRNPEPRHQPRYLRERQSPEQTIITQQTGPSVDLLDINSDTDIYRGFAHFAQRSSLVGQATSGRGPSACLSVRVGRQLSAAPTGGDETTLADLPSATANSPDAPTMTDRAAPARVQRLRGQGRKPYSMQETQPSTSVPSSAI